MIHLGLGLVSRPVLKSSCSCFNYQSVRYGRRRKPFWLGYAKSKIFVVKEPKRYPEPIQSTVDQLNPDFRTYVKSIASYLQDYPDLPDEDPEDYLDDLQRNIEASIMANEEWNAESALRREERQQKEAKEKTELMLKNIQRAEEQKTFLLAKANEFVQAEKEKAKSYITEANIDQAIDHCLNNLTVYDFAVNKNGERYVGCLQVRQQNQSIQESAAKVD